MCLNWLRLSWQNTIDWVACKQPTFISHNPRLWQVQDQGTGYLLRVCFLFHRQTSFCCVLTRQKDKGFLWDLFSPSFFYLFPKFQSRNPIVLRTSSLGFPIDKSNMSKISYNFITPQNLFLTSVYHLQVHSSHCANWKHQATLDFSVPTTMTPQQALPWVWYYASSITHHHSLSYHKLPFSLLQEHPGWPSCSHLYPLNHTHGFNHTLGRMVFSKCKSDHNHYFDQNLRTSHISSMAHKVLEGLTAAPTVLFSYQTLSFAPS